MRILMVKIQCDREENLLHLVSPTCADVSMEERGEREKTGEEKRREERERERDLSLLLASGEDAKYITGAEHTYFLC